jgi:hypothetical protein
MQLDYQAGRETVAYFEPDYEQVIVLRGLLSLAQALDHQKDFTSGNFVQRRKTKKRTMALLRDATRHMHYKAEEDLSISGENNLEIVQRGVERLLDEGKFDRWGGNAFGASVQHWTISEETSEIFKAHAQTIHLALENREHSLELGSAFKSDHER